MIEIGDRHLKLRTQRHLAPLALGKDGTLGRPDELGRLEVEVDGARQLLVVASAEVVAQARPGDVVDDDRVGG